MTRTPFTTSRLLEFTSIPELTRLVGADPADWPLVAGKELGDNALDATEEAQTAPVIGFAISTANGTISVTDNGPGIAADTVARLLDYQRKTSSREAYAGPTRGQQGNALQALLAMPFALDGTVGKSTIEAHGVAHVITFGIDPIRRVPVIKHERKRSSVHSGTCVTLRWPVSASSQFDAVKGKIISLVRNFSWLNPHAAFTLRWDRQVLVIADATDPSWRKWRPDDPAPAHWYDDESFKRLIAACVADDIDHGRGRTVRDFIAEFRGLARTGVRAEVLDSVGVARMGLGEFFDKPELVTKLLSVMQEATKPVAAKDLGLLGKEHFSARFAAMAIDSDTFQYRRALCDVDGVPYAVEAAFGYCPDNTTHRRIVGVNWSPSLINPYRGLGLENVLADQRAGKDEPIILGLHLASPNIVYTDKAKSALVLPNEVANALLNAVTNVTAAWAKVRKAEERSEARRARRHELISRKRKVSVRDAAFELIPAAYMKASDDDKLWTMATNVMYAARTQIEALTGRKLDRQYFNQTLLPDFVAAHPEETATWKIAYDDRGHFREPHTGRVIGLGTIAVNNYLRGIHDPKLQEGGFVPPRIVTHGPRGAFGALLYYEKEGYDPLFEQVGFDRRFDLALMSCKGLSVTAARKLADEMCHEYRIPLLLLCDFDKAAFSMRATFARSNRRYTFENQIKIIDLGLRIGDIGGLDTDGHYDEGSAEKRAANLRMNGATPEEIEFLLQRRVELNAMTSRQLVDFVERKLVKAGVRKIVPKQAELADAYRLFSRGHEVEKIIKLELKRLDGGAQVIVPRDLATQVKDYLGRHPTARWDDAVAAVVRRRQSIFRR